jgi:RNA polymerase sigma-70 factor (ECF subfamily)
MNARLEHALADEPGVLPTSGGEKVSVQEIVRRHHDSLIKFLRRRLTVGDDADDVAQETYIRMMKYEGSRDIKSPSAMLFRIAVNVANDHGRAAQSRCSRNHCDIEEVILESQQPSAERSILASQNLDMLLDAIEGLPQKCKKVFLLSRAHGMTYAEIAAHCGISVKMVEKQISRAVAVCLKKVGGIDGITS